MTVEQTVSTAQPPAPQPEPTLAVPPGLVADALFYSVSHDLRSPLLTMSLAADLITDALNTLPSSAGGPVAIALDALRHGARDMERMLQALTLLSRARRRPLGPRGATLPLLLGGHVVISDEGDLGDVRVAVDPIVVRDILDAVAGDQPAEVHVRLDGDHVVLSCAGFQVDGDPHGSPLEMLVNSLHHHAGTPVEAVAVSQVVLERQGGSVECQGERLVVRLPLAG